MKCEIHSIALATAGGMGGGATIVSICKTHNWQFGDLPVGPETICPIGRVESVTDEAVAYIKKNAEEATKQAIESILDRTGRGC